MEPPHNRWAIPSTEPIRTCVGCRTKAPRSVLLRITLDGDRLVVGMDNPGRGAWLCSGSTIDCFDRATATKAWARALRGRVDAASVEELRRRLR